MRRSLPLLLILLWAPACGGDDGGNPADDEIDASGTGDHPDGQVPAGCDPSGDAAECNDCVDNDHDGRIDGEDIECTGAIDDDESSFETGIPGDNQDKTWQDCFFDGNSGGGDDKCAYPTCCLFPPGVDCPSDFEVPNFDRDTDCTVTQECIDNCGPLAPPGCDCFGCCTICNDMGCFDVITHPEVAPNCTAAVAHDETLCPRCVQNDDCGGGDCVSLECVLCPGETEEDLPPECTAPECPSGVTPCTSNEDCTADQYCSAGCCIHIIG
jgi:hypothetical protein